MFARERHLTRLMMRLLEQRAWVDGGSAFSSMASEKAGELVWRWELDGGLWGTGIRAIRALCAMMFFGDARVQKALAWDVGCAVGRAP
jgi:hypothetical protein